MGHVPPRRRPGPRPARRLGAAARSTPGSPGSAPRLGWTRPVAWLGPLLGIFGSVAVLGRAAADASAAGRATTARPLRGARPPDGRDRPAARRERRPGHHELPDLARRDPADPGARAARRAAAPTSSTWPTTRAFPARSSSCVDRRRARPLAGRPRHRRPTGADCFRELDLGAAGPADRPDPLGGRPRVRGRLPMSDDPYTPKSDGASTRRDAMPATAASTDSTRRRPRRSATARTRCGASASATARPTPRSSRAGRRCATSSTRSSASRTDGGARHDARGADVDRARRRGRGRRRRRPRAGAARRRRPPGRRPRPTTRPSWPSSSSPSATSSARGCSSSAATRRCSPRPARRRPPSDLQMRIVEAQEAERSRLAQEIHDGPAQALIERDLPGRVHRAGHRDRPAAGPRPSCASCASCCAASSATCAAFISQLRPPLLDELGLDGAIADTVEHACGR